MAMYGYGYRYPRVPRKVEALNDDPTYLYKWARSAIMNRGVVSESPWIKFLRDNRYLEDVSKILRKAGEKYRALYGVKLKYKTAAERRKTKIERAIAAIQDTDIQNRLKSEFGNQNSDDYVKDAVTALQKELNHLKEIIEWKGPQQPPPQPSTITKTGQGYGLMSGLGYDEGYGYFY